MVFEFRNDFGRREAAEVILGRAEFLDEVDRVLLEQVLDKGVLMRQIALLSGKSVRSVQKRVEVLSKRLIDPGVVYVIRHHGRWTRAMGKVALNVWVRKRTLRETARVMGMSLHQVRRAVEAVKGIIAEGMRGKHGVIKERGELVA